ncbi:MAG: hypothetical protein HYW15_03135 [Candidatus Giovannonibacteria bacterium]|nr:MAG: hypothetical protein HYW15_03135 [Candidatus Giovannonibacteria bacterium]
MAEWKERYEEIQPKLEKKRFYLSRESFSKERLRVLKEEFGKFQENHPEVLALNLYGSMTKGYAKPESDIDGYFFLSGDAENPSDLAEDFKNTVSGRLEGVGLSFQLRRLNEGELESVIDSIVEDYNREKSILPYTSMESAVGYFGNKCERMAELFIGISLGNGLKQYRENMLFKLQSLGEPGEKIWHKIVEVIMLLERPKMRPGFADSGVRQEKYKALYPQTVEEAIKNFVEHKPFRQKYR